LYDIHFTYNLAVKERLEKEFGLPAYWLPFGFDISEETLAKSEQQKEVLKACFIGNPDAQRVKLLQFLASGGIQLDVYGNHWKKYLHHANVTIFPPVFESGLYAAIRRYRVQLNPLRPHNLTSHGMRSFEVPAIGGIVLSQDTPEHRIFFEEGREAFFYQGFDECLAKLNYILNLPFEEAEMIRRNARKRSVDSGYDYKDRAAFVRSVLDDYYAQRS
jgi:spore maturation protein CgeB